MNSQWHRGSIPIAGLLASGIWVYLTLSQTSGPEINWSLAICVLSILAYLILAPSQLRHPLYLVVVSTVAVLSIYLQFHPPTGISGALPGFLGFVPSPLGAVLLAPVLVLTTRVGPFVSVLCLCMLVGLASVYRSADLLISASLAGAVILLVFFREEFGHARNFAAGTHKEDELLPVGSNSGEALPAGQGGEVLPKGDDAGEFLPRSPGHDWMQPFILIRWQQVERVLLAKPVSLFHILAVLIALIRVYSMSRWLWQNHAREAMALGIAWGIWTLLLMATYRLKYRKNAEVIADDEGA